MSINPANYFDDRPAEIDVGPANEHVGPLSAHERIRWAADTFGDGLFAMTSAGIDSAVVLDLIDHTARSIPVVHINTGFLHEETLAHRDRLKELYGFELYEFGPSAEQIADITERELWAAGDDGLAEYRRLTKTDPLTRAVGELGITALISGVRADQTQNRSTLDVVGEGRDGELRIHPILDWPAGRIDTYIDSKGLPRHPFYYEGGRLVGDWTMPTDVKGECGLHTRDGEPIRRDEIPVG
jgi:phosphoadenosine phosphosulfate reductase